MLTTNYIRENIETVINGLKKRGFDEKRLTILTKVIDTDNLRKRMQTQMDEELNKVNVLSKQIGELYKSGEREKADILKQEVAIVKGSSKQLEDEFKNIKASLEKLLLDIPNIPHPSVPDGQAEEDNEVHKAWEQPLPNLYEGAVPHWDLIERYNLVDFKLGTKITGAGFPLYRSKGAKLQRALINFFLDEATNAGYEEIIPPLLVNGSSAKATGQLPDKEGQMYHCTKDDLYLIPTAEVPITNIYRGEILKKEDFPIKLTGHTPCFRREAGSYGADVKGLNRVHQFDKIEIVQIEHPEKSYDTLKNMMAHVEGLLNKLELPYRILRLCGGDIGFTSALTFDFEVFAAGQEKWLEVSSVSNFETYQANRMKLRYKDETGKTQLAHTLNGSALALARIVAAILENNQTSDGIKVPKVLIPYTRFDIIN